MLHETLEKKYSFVTVSTVWFAASAMLYIGNTYLGLPDQIYSTSKGLVLPIPVLILFYKGKLWKKALMFALMWAVALLSEWLGYLVIWRAFSIQDDYYVIMISEHIGVSSGRLLVSTIMLICVVIIVMIMRFREFRRERLLGPILAVLGYALAHTIYLTIYLFVNADNITQTSNLIQLIFQALLNTFIFIQYYSIKQVGKLLNSEKKLSLLENEMSDNERYFELANSKFEEISALKNELSEKLAEVTQLMAEPSGREKAGDIMDSISERLNSIRAVNYCDNHTLNAVLTLKLNEERFRDIPVQMTLRDCTGAGIDSYEMCSIVSNLFDNAAESCLRAPDISKTFIDIKSGIRGNFFIMKVTNTCVGEFDAETSKGPGHGYGLGIIREICKKHGGRFTVSQDGDTVTSSAFLGLEE